MATNFNVLEITKMARIISFQFICHSLVGFFFIIFIPFALPIIFHILEHCANYYEKLSVDDDIDYIHLLKHLADSCSI